MNISRVQLTEILQFYLQNMELEDKIMETILNTGKDKMSELKQLVSKINVNLEMIQEWLPKDEDSTTEQHEIRVLTEQIADLIN